MTYSTTIDRMGHEDFSSENEDDSISRICILCIKASRCPTFTIHVMWEYTRKLIFSHRKRLNFDAPRPA